MFSERFGASHSIKAIKGLRCSAHLDLLRGADAILVVLVHLTDLFFDTSHARSGMVGDGVKFVVAQGSSAVLTFFVLSGYLVALSLVERVRKPGSPWINYAITRFSRLYIVLIPSLLLCAAWDWLGMRLFGLHNVYNGVTLGTLSAPDSVLSRLTPAIFWGNVFSLQNITVPSFGSNGALWSLSCEVWYYILFPILLCALYPRKTIWWQRLLFIAAFVAGVHFIGIMSFYFLIWLMGVTLIFIPLTKLTEIPSLWRFGGFAALLIFITRLTVAANFEQSKLTSCAILGFSCMACIYFILHDRKPIASRLDKAYGKSAAFLASFSYSLYLVHMPMLYFIRAAVVKDKLWACDAQHGFYAVLIFSAVLLYGWIVARYTEEKTGVLRSLLFKVVDAMQSGVSEQLKAKHSVKR